MTKPIIKKPLKDGRKQASITLEEGEVVMIVKRDAFYQLGEPIDEIVHTETLLGVKRVQWCTFSQSWEPV